MRYSLLMWEETLRCFIKETINEIKHDAVNSENVWILSTNNRIEKKNKICSTYLGYTHKNNGIYVSSVFHNLTVYLINVNARILIDDDVHDDRLWWNQIQQHLFNFIYTQKNVIII